MMASPALSLASFPTFGDLLKFLRRRERLTQLDLSIAVGYSEAQISRLEQNQRLPDLAALKALFIPALGLEDEPELAGRLLELAQSARQEDAPAPGLPPYKGLLYFDPEDSEIFFGREALTAYLAQRVARLQSDSSIRMLSIVGASGSGKSSLARSGLGVCLQRAGWALHLFTPGAEPLQTLRWQLEKADPGSTQRCLLVIDQFEETFTLCREETRRAAFIDKLLNLAQAPTGNCTVVLALRADFYSHLAQYPRLREAVAAQQEYIGQMSAEDLRRAIEEPAKSGGWQFEPGLVDLMLHDVGVDGSGQPEPGALPLLSHALLETWQRRRARTLTLEGYRAAGGVHSAIAETAESVFTDQLNREQQELARSVFLRLTELGEGTEDTRRRASLNELVRRAEEAPTLRSVLDALASARLVTLNEDSAEVAHEALIREWQRLREWLTDDRDGLRLHRHLSESAHDWEQRSRDPSELYRGARLAQGQEWAASNDAMLNPLERAFLAASFELERRAELEREAQRQREMETVQKLAAAQAARAEAEQRAASRLRLRNRMISIVGAVTFVLAVIAAAFAIQARQNTLRAQTAEAQAVDQRNLAVKAQATAQAEQERADAEKRLASSRELAAAAIANLNADSDRSVLLALYAVSQAQTKEARDALHASVLNMRTKAILPGYTLPLSALIFSPDGKRIALASFDNSAGIWNAATGKEEVSIQGHADWASMLAFSPDGKRLAVASEDKTARIYDAFTGQKLLSVSHADSVSYIAFSPDGTRFATTSNDGTAKVWGAVSGRLLLDLQGHTDSVWGICFNNDGSRLVTASNDRTARVWDAATGRQLLKITAPDAVHSAGFSPDGTKLVIGLGNGAIQVFDAAAGKLLLSWSGHTGAAKLVSFSPDGTQVASGGPDHLVRLWDAETGQPLMTLGGTFGGFAFSPDGKQLMTSMPDNSARIWDITPAGSHELLTVDTGNASGLRNVGYRPDGKRFVTCGFGGDVQVWDAQSGAELMRLAGHEGSVYRCIYSRDGTRIATSGADGTQRVWDAATGKELLHLPASGDRYAIGQWFPGVMGIAFSPDGRLLAAGHANNMANVWDIATGRELYAIPSSETDTGLISVGFSPDGKLLMTASDDNAKGGIHAYDAATGSLLHTVTSATRRTWDLAFSPDGKRLATTNGDNITQIWYLATWKELVHIQAPTTSESTAVSFSPDGKQVATVANDGNVNIWDSSSGQALLTLHVSSGVPWGLTYSPDGSRLLVTTGRTATVFALRTDDLVALARARLTRSFTTEECQQYLHLATCPSGP